MYIWFNVSISSSILRLQVVYQAMKKFIKELDVVTHQFQYNLLKFKSLSNIGKRHIAGAVIFAQIT